MTAPALALDAFCGSPACHGHRCPRVRHGYVRGEMRGKCSTHRGCRAFELDELAACEPAVVVPAVPGSTDCLFCRAFTVGSPAMESTVCECERWCGAERCSHHPDQVAARERYLAAKDSPAGPDGDVTPGPSHRPLGGLPGTTAGTLISAWNAWHCPTCSSRWFTPASCCGRAPIPVRIEMHVREADGG